MTTLARWMAVSRATSCCSRSAPSRSRPLGPSGPRRRPSSTMYPRGVAAPSRARFSERPLGPFPSSRCLRDRPSACPSAARSPSPCAPWRALERLRRTPPRCRRHQPGLLGLPARRRRCHGCLRPRLILPARLFFSPARFCPRCPSSCPACSAPLSFRAPLQSAPLLLLARCHLPAPRPVPPRSVGPPYP